MEESAVETTAGTGKGSIKIKSTQKGYCISQLERDPYVFLAGKQTVMNEELN